MAWTNRVPEERLAMENGEVFHDHPRYRTRRCRAILTHPGWPIQGWVAVSSFLARNLGIFYGASSQSLLALFVVARLSAVAETDVLKSPGSPARIPLHSWVHTDSAVPGDLGHRRSPRHPLRDGGVRTCFPPRASRLHTSCAAMLGATDNVQLRFSGSRLPADRDGSPILPASAWNFICLCARWPRSSYRKPNFALSPSRS